MKHNLTVIGVFLSALVLSACSEDTDEIGSSISEYVDGINVETATFDVASQSIVVDSVLSSNSTGYLGKVRDAETGTYVTADFMTQFYCLENYQFPNRSNMVAYDSNGNVQTGEIEADSCEIRLFFTRHYGDSTNTMKLTAYELGRVMTEDRSYYSNFDPMAEGYVRKDGIHKDKVYALTDFNIPQHERDTSTYEPYITIKLNDSYTDKEGRVYKNFGTYVLQKYYDDPDNFKNAYTFRQNVVPGFFFKHKSGLGSMAYIDVTQLDVYYKYRTRIADSTSVSGQTVYRDSVMKGTTVFWGTDEVLQTTTINNDKTALSELASDNSCTYLKTPAGIFTELTLPVDDIVSEHGDYSLASAKIAISRINNADNSDYAFDVPKNILMVPYDSLYSFFEKDEMYNNRTTFVAAYSKNDNKYTFNNISNLISWMASIPAAQRSPNWNKVVLVPVTVTTSTTTNTNSSYYNNYYYYYGYYPQTTSSSSSIQKVSNDMSLTSTRLVKGTSSDSPIKIEIIYSKFQ